ncbi:hypothetical protein [Bdellovibrio bacteriovorus]|uniref:hypothetical protein n=1 Tax=Bdellovibrio bacteriovorus TaxID=959 RepID=UPI0035A6659E
MKSTWTKILFSALVLTLAACSGGGGGGGGGSVSGDVASPNPTIANPPTKASGSVTDLGSILGTADEAATQTAVQTMVNDFQLPRVSVGSSNILKNFSNMRAGDSCVTANREAWNEDLDKDHFLDDASLKATNCVQVKGGGGSALFNATLQAKDSNTDSFWANASIAFSGNVTYKNENEQVNGQDYYSFKSTLDMSKGALSIYSKEGGYDKVMEVPPSYSASWLTFTATELGAVSLSGYMQEYAEGKGLVTLQVVGTGGQIDDVSECIENLNVVVKDGNGTVVATVIKNLCLNTSPVKAGLK